MKASISKTGQFHRGQTVCFVGGKGTIRSSKLESGNWTHLVEMEMGPEPEVGRIGYETTIWLFESDLNTVEGSLTYHLAIA